MINIKIGILGGSFNPPHKKHIEIAQKLIDKNYVNKVITVPTGDNYLRKDNLVPFEHRYNMLKLLERPGIEVSDISKVDKYTYEVLDYFNNGTDEIYFICGLDNLNDLETWKNYQYILDKYKLLVIDRPGYYYDELIKKYNSNNIIKTDIEISSISSTTVRERLANSLDVTDYLDDSVIKYINDNALYK